MFENTPRWFLQVAITAVIATLPFIISQSNRITALETEMKASRISEQRIITVLDRIDGSVGKLAESVSSLKTEVKNIKES